LARRRAGLWKLPELRKTLRVSRNSLENAGRRVSHSSHSPDGGEGEGVKSRRLLGGQFLTPVYTWTTFVLSGNPLLGSAQRIVGLGFLYAGLALCCAVIATLLVRRLRKERFSSFTLGRLRAEALLVGVAAYMTLAVLSGVTLLAVDGWLVSETVEATVAVLASILTAAGAAFVTVRRAASYALKHGIALCIAVLPFVAVFSRSVWGLSVLVLGGAFGSVVAVMTRRSPRDSSS
jgi:hypothetical protein